jgi:hypothetical protein
MVFGIHGVRSNGVVAQTKDKDALHTAADVARDGSPTEGRPEPVIASATTSSATGASLDTSQGDDSGTSPPESPPGLPPVRKGRSAPGPRGRRNAKRPVRSDFVPDYLDVESAAASLAVSPQALRARCRRAADVEDGRIIARLGPCVAIKFGTSWRFWFVQEVAAQHPRV